MNVRDQHSDASSVGHGTLPNSHPIKPLNFELEGWANLRKKNPLETVKMKARWLFQLCWLGLAAALVVAGCDAWKGSGEVAEQPIPTGTALPLASIGGLRQEKLTLNLEVGSRFPLQKTVEHVLRQPSPEGTNTVRGLLDLLMSVTVEEVRAPDSDQASGNARRLRVKYHRVRFSQEFPDGRNNVQYDSDAPPPDYQIPLEALGYHGLKDNSFEFWLGADNQILGIVDFDKFLQRCLAKVPKHQQIKVRGHLAATSGADGISNFVDDSIGLLPSHAVRVNEVWSRERTLPQPVPMHISNRYTLRQLTRETADVDIVGVITPSTTYGPPNQLNRDVQVSVTGGNCIGSCQIDRLTGLPIQSRVEQSMMMNVRLPQGVEFQQQKNTVITIRAFPRQTSEDVARQTKPGSSRSQNSDARVRQ